MNVLRIDYTLGEVEFRIDDKKIVINDYGRENNKDLTSFGFESFIDPLGQSCYAMNCDFQGYIFYAKIIYKDGFLKLINFAMVGSNIDEYNEWDYEGNYKAIKKIFDQTSFYRKSEDDYKSYTDYFYDWGAIAAYYSRIGLDANFSIRFLETKKVEMH